MGNVTMLKIISQQHNKKTIAIDFDGVLHSHQSGWNGNVPTDPPVSGAREFVQSIVSSGYEVVIFSCRAESSAGKDGIISWLKNNQFPDVPVTNTKPIAELYIDDRGYRFNGDFNEVLNIINKQDFNPWYKKN